MPDAGWYPDPQDAQSHQFWDGARWTGERRPAGAQTPAAQAPERSGPAAEPQLQPQMSQSSQSQPQMAQSSQSQQQQSWGAVQHQNQPYGHAPQHPTQELPPAPAYPVDAPQAPAPQQQPGWVVPGAAPGAGQWQPSGGPDAAQWGGPPPTQPRSRKRTPLFIGLGVVILLVAALAAVVLWPSSKAAPKFTYQGKEIAAPDKVLAATEPNVRALVQQRHGAQKSARCYYAQPKNPVSGQKKTDVDQSLLCGPVLFVDGDTSRSYLAVPLTSSATGDTVTLAAQQSLDGIEPTAVDSGLTLVRPDGKSAPQGSGGLTVPEPQPASSRLLVAASLGSTNPPAPLDNAKIEGKTTSVTVTAAGEIQRYGDGDKARSAPRGGKLIAFQVDYGSGAVTGSGSARAAVSVDSGGSRQLPDASGTDQWIIVAVPAAGSAELQFNDGGFPQTLSLPDGRPGADNIAVLSREHRTDILVKSAAVPVHISNRNGSANVTFQARATVASLNFWVPRHTARHPSDVTHAMLSVDLDYTDPNSPGKRYGFDPQLLRLRLPNGAVIAARNVASTGKIYNVFEVPADFTRGSLEIAGSELVQGLTVRVTRTVSFAIDISAG